MAPTPDALRRAAETFEDYLRVERGASPATVIAYRAEIKRYLTFLARAKVKQVDDVMAKHVLDAMNARASGGAASSTLNRTLAAVRHFHKFCVREGIATANPAALVDGPGRGLSLPKAMDEDLVTKLIEAASGSLSDFLEVLRR